MKKKVRGISLVMSAVMMAVSIGYFALLAPTTAWFYQDEEKAHQFTFGDFDVNQTPQSANIIAERLIFPAATRFADTDEILFDEVAHVIEVDVENRGDLPAKLSVTLAGAVGSTSYGNAGLKWCVINKTVRSFSQEPSSVEHTSQISKGVYKSAIENILTSEMTLHKYGDFNTSDISAAESEYESYNAGAKTILNQNNGAPILIPGKGAGGSLKKVYIVFWIEYGEVSELLLPESVTKLDDYGVSIQLTAAPNIEGADLTITNNFGASATVLVSFGNTTYSGGYTIGGSTFLADGGSITLAAGQSATIHDIALGTFYTVAPSSGSYKCSDAHGTITSSGAAVEISAT